MVLHTICLFLSEWPNLPQNAPAPELPGGSVSGSYLEKLEGSVREERKGGRVGVQQQKGRVGFTVDPNISQGSVFSESWGGTIPTIQEYRS